MLTNRFYKPLFYPVYTWVIVITCVVLLHPLVVDSRGISTTNTTASILLLESPSGDTSGFGVLPAVEMGIEDVNCSPEVLPGTLNLLRNSTKEEVQTNNKVIFIMCNVRVYMCKACICSSFSQIHCSFICSCACVVLMLYCIKMFGKRFPRVESDNQDVNAMARITEAFGPDFWRLLLS